MKDKILGISIGTNNGNLYGSKNDSILFYNFLYYLYEKNEFKEYWLEPLILNNDKIIIKNLIDLIQKKNYNFKYLLLFYSGHGNYEGILNIYRNEFDDIRINDIDLIKHISNIINNEITLFIILDSCFAGSFKILPSINIPKISIITSTQSNEEASEGIVQIDQIISLFDKVLLKKDLNFKDKNLVMGIFTNNLIFLLLKYNLDSIFKWKLIFEDDIWEKINTIANQSPLIIWD